VPNSATNDTTTWETTSLGPGLTGNFSTRKITVNEASGNISHAGNITLGVDGFLFAAGNTRQWYQSGIITVSGAQTWALSNTAQGFWLVSAGSLAGTSNITLTNNSGTSNGTNAYIVLNGAFASYSGTLIFKDYTRCIGGSGATSGALTNGNITIDGIGCDISVQPGLSVLGSASRTLTFNFDATLGSGLATLPIAMNVTLAGAGARTLTLVGNVTITGNVTSSNGISIAASSHYRTLTLTAGRLAAVSGAATLTGGGLDVPAGSWTPTAIDVGSNSRFRFTLGSSDFNFPRTPTGVGIVSIGGTFAGNGVTFPASPTEGNIDSFTGSVEAYSASGGNSKVRISELPGGLRLIGYANAASNPQATITYLGSGHSGATTLVIDSEDNTQLGNLTAGTYSLLSSGAGPIVLSGSVQRTNSNAGVTPLPASARMNLTLGGLNEGDNTLSGDISEASATATLGITKVGTGRWVLSGANSSHTGIHTISAGTLSAQSEKALGSATSAGGVFISGSGALELAGSITLNKSVTDFTVSNATNPIQSVGTNQLLTKQLTLSTTPTLTITSGNKLTLSPQGAGVIAGANGITKAGDGELELTAKANTFSGVVTVSAGTLAFGSSGSLGTGNVQVAGNLKYTGTGETYSRSTQLTSAAPSLEASGTGALTVSNLSQNTATKTLTLKGTNTDANKITSNLADNTGILSLAKEGTGQWVLPSVLSYTGTTTVSGGTLRVETTNSNTTSGAVTIGASGTVELITDTLASSGATAGEVLGTGNVTCNGGTIKTRGGTTQKGQVRYGGNLTFGSGSTLYIGAAA
jgi:fibronectin-binding autotransporter adhesin